MKKTKVSDHFKPHELGQLPLERLVDILPQNLVIYKDSGCWSIRDEQFNQLAVTYGGSLKALVLTYLLSLEYTEDIAYEIRWELAEFKLESLNLLT